jgi:L-galactose dehydrogenase/L-glyceraldehyde 3-phosphate reductase
MVQTVARAIELGITYFDTARLYGNGQSETNLGAVLQALGADVRVGTKVRLNGPELERIEAAIIESVEGSLRRLQMERVDLIQLHNSVALQRQPERSWIGIDDLEPVIGAFEKLQAQGKVRYWGINGLGETEALHQAVASGQADTIQCCYNLLNPSAGAAAPAGFPFQDYRRLIDRAAAGGMGVIAIRVLAGGALSGQPDRHPVAAAGVEPIASGRDYEEDVARASRFNFLIEEGYVGSLVEAAIRFALSKAEVSTALVGISSFEQLETAAAYANKGPLPGEALAKILE